MFRCLGALAGGEDVGECVFGVVFGSVGSSLLGIAFGLVFHVALGHLAEVQFGVFSALEIAIYVGEGEEEGDDYDHQA